LWQNNSREIAQGVHYCAILGKNLYPHGTKFRSRALLDASRDQVVDDRYNLAHQIASAINQFGSALALSG
jgi:hypothetical protein